MDENGWLGGAQEYDLDGDGVSDVFGYDTNGDGVSDVFYEDFDHNGVIDAIYTDYDYDGVIDTITLDTNQDGAMDMFMLDMDGDGVFETMDQIASSNAETSLPRSPSDLVSGEGRQFVDENGRVDFEVFGADFDGDSIEDDELILKYQYGKEGELLSTNVIMHEGETDTYKTLEIYSYLDVDGDKVVDQISYWQDINGDGRMDFYAKCDAQMEVINFEYLNDSYVNSARQVIEPTWAQYHGGNSDPSRVVGNVEDIDNWIFQGTTPSCDICTQKTIIESLTGKPVDINDLINDAMELGIYSPSDGVHTLNLDSLLKTHGLETKMYFNASIENIEDCLSRGGRVLVSVDSNEIWFPDDSSHYTSNSANHAVQVVGIDYTDDSNPMVILNDSGSPHGAGEMVPLAQFTGAWEDSGFQIVEAFG